MAHEKWNKLEEVMRRDIGLRGSLVFMHPGEHRDYTDAEMEAMENKHTFETSLYFTLTPNGGDSGMFL